jgi:predicted DNA-binding transcriptional regulator YafY
MMEGSARLLRLLSLLQTRREWTGAELAQRLEVDVRTVRRDVDKLRRLDYPVYATSGAAGGYRLGAGAALPPLLLDDEEAVAVAVGLRTAAGGSIAGIEETSVRALAKLEQVLPSRLRHRVNAFGAVTVPMVGRGPTVDPGTLTTIASACRDHQRLQFDYRDHANTGTARVCEPHRLVHSGRRWYLVAWDVERDDWRTFRVDRITPRIPVGPRFAPREPPAGDLAAYTSRGVSTEAYPYRGRFVLHVPIEEAAERVSPMDGVLEPIDAASCLLHAGAGSLDAFAFHLVMMGFDFTVLEPNALLSHVQELADRLGRAAASSALARTSPARGAPARTSPGR